jgi:hypothetical protein
VIGKGEVSTGEMELSKRSEMTDLHKDILEVVFPVIVVPYDINDISMFKGTMHFSIQCIETKPMNMFDSQ